MFQPEIQLLATTKSLSPFSQVVVDVLYNMFKRATIRSIVIVSMTLTAHALLSAVAIDRDPPSSPHEFSTGITNDVSDV